MENKEKLLDHDYDGIKELDNPLPGWWLATFYGTIVFAAIYFFYYHMGNGPGPKEELAKGLAEFETMSAASGSGKGIDSDKLNAFFHDSGRIKDGGAVFQLRCASCHGVNAEGNIGPNLTDKFWIHGDGSLAAIAKVVTEGVGDKGMPPWGAILKPDELYSVVAYVKTLKGSNPANGKAPQGNEVKD